MAKDDNKGARGRDNKSNGKQGQGHKRKDRGPPAKSSKAILKLGPPPASERTTAIKLNDALNNQVKERLDDWRDGDNARILIDVLSKSISICKKYNLYNNTGDWKAVAQGVSRALTGKCKKEWDKLVNDLNNWNAGGANKHKLLVQKFSQKVFKKKGYETQKDAMREGLSYQGHDHREAIEQLYELNKLLPFLCEDASSFDEEDFCRNVIPATLRPMARVDYIKKGGKNLRNEEEILDVLEEVMEGIEAELEYKGSQKRRKDFDNPNANDNGKRPGQNNDDKKGTQLVQEA